jgi:hypothetical protein
MIIYIFTGNGYDSDDDDALITQIYRLQSHVLTTIKNADLTEKSGGVIVMAALSLVSTL